MTIHKAQISVDNLDLAVNEEMMLIVHRETENRLRTLHNKKASLVEKKRHTNKRPQRINPHNPQRASWKSC